MKKFLLLVFTFFICQVSFAQLTPLVDSIPMRDSKKLAADVYLPNGGTTPLPTILIQTPYNRLLYHFSLPLNIGLNINASKYNIVILDWRCFYGSTSACVASPNRGLDGYDAVEWIAAQPWSNGKVGTWGASALGRVQFLTAQQHPPHLVCEVPLVAGPQYSYGEYYPGGVYRTEYVQTLDALGFGLSTTILAHPTRDGTWQYSESTTFYPQDIQVPTLMIGGWYDHNIEVMLAFYKGLKQGSPLNVRDKHRLLMGPWAHGTTSGSPAQVGELFYYEAVDKSDSMSLAFFDYHLRNVANGWDVSPYVSYFQMGENKWVTDTAWYIGNMMNVNWYMQKDKSLTMQPAASSTDNLSFVYDPRDPSPTVGGSTLAQNLNQGPYDQAPVVESRNDILTFTTATLPVDAVMRGSARIHLLVSSDRFDTDFAVRLTDVYPNGKSELVMDGIRRMRFRNGYAPTDTSKIIPGTIYSLDIDLPNTAITFLTGHKIRVDVTSSNYPRFDNNLNNAGVLYAAGDTLIATNTVYTNSVNASYLRLPLLNFTMGVNQVNHGDGISIYPNPANDRLWVMGSGLRVNSTSTLKMFNAVGEMIHTTSLEKGISEGIDLSNIPSGIYFLRIEGEQNTLIRKITVVH